MDFSPLENKMDSVPVLIMLNFKTPSYYDIESC